VTDITPAVSEQLREGGGRLVAICTDGGTGGQAVLAEATMGGLRKQPMFDCASPPIPMLASAPAFVF
jgi:protein-L-isoaspartate(D-aspartate) O-methyltransferase